MNIEQLRQSVRETWLNYYRENRQWLTRLGVWANYDGQRRPSSSFILATLTALEPQLTQLLPLIVDLNNNPDRIVAALGLNFNPDEQLERSILSRNGASESKDIKLLPATNAMNVSVSQQPINQYAKLDESCQGSKRDRE